MKRTLLLCALSLSLFLGACQGVQPDDPLTREYETYTGEFKNLGGIKAQAQITHLFETDEGEILYAYSDRYDLDDEDYFEKHVEVYGVVTTYEDLDKALFEVKRITDALESDAEETEVTLEDYQDPDLGFSITYPSNWTLTTSIQSVSLEAPTLITEEDTEEDFMNSDTIYIAKIDPALAKTNEDTQEDRATEIRELVSTYYPELSGVANELTYVGTDRQLSVRYKKENGSVTYFVPRAHELFELSFIHYEDSEEQITEYSNIFSALVSSFRFTPYGESYEKPKEEEEMKEPEEEAPTTEQVTLNVSRELESKTFEFKMLYPSNWYYFGDKNGFYFADEPIEESTGNALIQMAFNATQTEGIGRSGDVVNITVKVGSRYYTFGGSSAYESAMQEMADSIQSTKMDSES